MRTITKSELEYVAAIVELLRLAGGERDPCKAVERVLEALAERRIRAATPYGLS